MERRRIGGLEVSVVGLGCNNFGGRIDEARALEVVDAALDCGITLLDTADNYAGSLSEEILGRALKGRRDQVVLATEFGGWNDTLGRETGATAATVRASVEASLRRLATDRIDLSCVVGHRRRHHPRPSTGQRRGRRMAAHHRRPGLPAPVDASSAPRIEPAAASV